MLQTALTALHQGLVIGLPTETLFGLAADPWHPQAMGHLIRMKGRPMDKGFILLIHNPESLNALILPPSPLASDLMKQFWPGPLTLVLPARPDLPPLLTGGSGFVAVRHSPSPIVGELLAAWNKPLISTSANRAGEAPPDTAEGVRAIWPDEKLVVLDGPIRPQALPSTLLRVEGQRATLLRPGAIPVEVLERLLPDLLGA
ncbi:MAG: L-threonylcarbamoyladenylate synthase [Magnetococcales bacterium]|nr:L-threonylcarbamoyladenylate synthase [Magnetococcales bacterium]